MRILLTSSTNVEIGPFKKKVMPVKGANSQFSHHLFNNEPVDILITGISGITTCYSLVKTLYRHSYDLVINAGIAGSFNKNIAIGTVVNVTKEQFCDMGIEDHHSFYTLFEKGLLQPDEFPFEKGILLNKTNPGLHAINKLPEVSGVTSNTVHGNANSINFIRERFHPDVESMEGAYFFYLCLKEKIPFLQFRAISNFVEPRDTGNWDIPLAVKNLTNTLLEVFDEINVKKPF